MNPLNKILGKRITVDLFSKQHKVFQIKEGYSCPYCNDGKLIKINSYDNKIVLGCDKECTGRIYTVDL